MTKYVFMKLRSSDSLGNETSILQVVYDKHNFCQCTVLCKHLPPVPSSLLKLFLDLFRYKGQYAWLRTKKWVFDSLKRYQKIG